MTTKTIVTGLAGACLSLLAYSAFAADKTITLGERDLLIPLPDGFTELTSEFGAFYEMSKTYKAPTNNRYVSLIEDGDAEVILAGEDVILGRYMNIESEKNIAGQSLSQASFDELRAIVAEQYEQVYEEMKDQLEDNFADADREVSKMIDRQVITRAGGMVTLPVHTNNENSVANSVLMTTEFAIEGEATVETVIAFTSNILFVRDKVLFLYVYGKEEDLEWTRSFARDWGEQILERNPREASDYNPSNNRGGINWNLVLISGLIGGVIALIGKGIKKRRPGDGES